MKSWFYVSNKNSKNCSTTNFFSGLIFTPAIVEVPLDGLLNILSHHLMMGDKNRDI